MGKDGLLDEKLKYPRNPSGKLGFYFHPVNETRGKIFDPAAAYPACSGTLEAGSKARRGGLYALRRSAFRTRPSPKRIGNIRLLFASGGVAHSNRLVDLFGKRELAFHLQFVLKSVSLLKDICHYCRLKNGYFCVANRRFGHTKLILNMSHFNPSLLTISR